MPYIRTLLTREQLFESLRKQNDPKKLEEKAKVVAERAAAQNAKAQEILGELVRYCMLFEGNVD